jgi:hypothetical protein
MSYADDLRKQITEMKEFIEPFETGKQSCAERTGNGPWRDTTQELITRERTAITNLESILAAMMKKT